MASRSLGTLTVDLIAKVGGFTKGMTQAEREADKSAKAIERRMKRLAAGIDAALQIAGAAAIAAAGAIAVGMKSAIDRMDEIAKSAQKVGIGTEALSKLAYAAELSGVEFGQLEGALAKLAKSQDMAAQGSREQLEIFRALGIEFQRADGTLRSTDEVLADIADRFRSMPDGANKTAAAMALLGRSGAQLIPLLNGGSDGLREMGDELDRLGGVITPEAAKQAEQFNDDLSRLKTAANSLWITLASDLLPDLVELTNKLVESAKEGGELRDTVRTLAGGIRDFATYADIAADSVQALTLQAIGMYNVVSGIGKLNPGALLATAFGGMESAAQDFRDAQDAFALINAQFEGGPSGTARQGTGPGIGSGRTPRGRAIADPVLEAMRAEEAEKALADALKKQREEQERAAAARDAAARSARAQAEADREAEAQARAFEAAQSALAGVLRAQAEEMGGPLAQAAFEYQDTMVQLAGVEEELIRLGKLDEEQQAKLALARENATRKYQEQTAAIQNQLSPMEELMASLDMELGLMRLGNVERATELELQRLIYEYRQKGIELTEDEIEANRRRIEAKFEEIEALDQQISALDDFRSSFEDNVAGVLDGSQSIKDAFRDLVDDLIAQLARLAAQKFTESLFGQQGTAGGGMFGDLFGSLFGAFTARASGGPVYPGQTVLVGEEGPELIRPMGAGTVIPAGQTAAMRAGSGRRGGDTFVIQGATSNRAIERIRMERDRADRKAQREFA